MVLKVTLTFPIQISLTHVNTSEHSWVYMLRHKKAHTNAFSFLSTKTANKQREEGGVGRAGEGGEEWRGGEGRKGREDSFLSYHLVLSAW